MSDLFEKEQRHNTFTLPESPENYKPDMAVPTFKLPETVENNKSQSHQNYAELRKGWAEDIIKNNEFQEYMQAGTAAGYSLGEYRTVYNSYKNGEIDENTAWRMFSSIPLTHYLNDYMGAKAELFEVLRDYDGHWQYISNDRQNRFPTAKSQAEALTNSIQIAKNMNPLGKMGNELKELNTSLLQTRDEAEKKEIQQQADELWQKITALQDENAELGKRFPQDALTTILSATIQSAPLTGKSMLGGAIGAAGGAIIGGVPGMGMGYRLGSFAASSADMAGLLYVDLLRAGIEKENAGRLAVIGGGLQGVIEVGLGTIPGLGRSAIKAVGGKVLSEAAQKKIAEAASKNFITKISQNVMASPAARNIISRTVFDTARQAGEEGLEEGLQFLVEHAMLAIGDAMQDSPVERDLWGSPEFQAELKQSVIGGIAGGIGFGIVGLPLTVTGNIRDTARQAEQLKNLAVNSGSKEEFKAAAKENPLTKNFNDKHYEQVWDSSKTEREAEENARAQELRNRRLYGAMDPSGDTYRNETNALYMEHSRHTESNGITTGEFAAGDPHKSEKNSYAIGNYELRGDTVAITEFRIGQKYEGLQDEILQNFADDIGSEIEYNGQRYSPISEGRSMRFGWGEQAAQPMAKTEAKAYRFDFDRQPYTAADTQADTTAKKNFAKQLRSLDTKISSDIEADTVVDFYDTVGRKWFGMGFDSFMSRMTGGKKEGWVHQDLSDAQIARWFANNEGVLTDAAAVQHIQENLTDAQREEARASIHGFAVTGADGVTKAIYAARDADVSTFIHEGVHAFTKLAEAVDPALYRGMMEAAGLDMDEYSRADAAGKEQMTRQAMEKLAYGAEAYLKEGPKSVQNTALRNLYDKIKEFLKDLADAIEKGKFLSPEVRSLFDNLFGEEAGTDGTGGTQAAADKSADDAGAATGYVNKTEPNISDHSDDISGSEELEIYSEDLKRKIKDKSLPIEERSKAAVQNAELEMLDKQDRDHAPTAELIKRARRITDPALQKEVIQEIRELRKRYKGTKAEFKAPNGKESLLLSSLGEEKGREAWYAVRLENFKRWFGDWELAARIEAIEALEAQEIKPGESLNKKEAEAQITSDKKLINKNDKRIAQIPLNTIGKILDHKGYNTSSIIKDIPKLFETSVFGWTESERNIEGHKPHRNIKAYHNYINKFSDGSNEYFIRFTLSEERTKPGKTGKNNIHSTAISDISIYKKTMAPVVSGIIDPGVKNTSSFIDNKLIQFFDSVNPDSISKVVDKNGEPLVVYHGTLNKFEIFDRNKGKLNDAGWLGEGHYFYGDYNESTGYARGTGKIMECFINVKEPYYLSEEENRDLSEQNDRNYSKEHSEGVKDEGYDGVYYNGDLRKEWMVFNSNQIKSATGNVGTFDTLQDNIYFQIIGELGAAALDRAEEATHRMDNLAVARKMEEANKDAMVIRTATGWERGADGKWRYEIPDIEINEDGLKTLNRWDGVYLKELVIAEDLFKAYPDVNKKNVLFIERAKSLKDYNVLKSYSNEFDGVFRKKTKDIEIAAYHLENNIEEVKNILIHEIQHAIQEIEGFAEGGNPDGLSPIDIKKQLLKKIRDAESKAYNEIPEYLKNDARRIMRGEDSDGSSLNRIQADPTANTVWADVIKAMQDYEEEKANALTAKERYNRLAGEVEARNAQNRSNMSAARRAYIMLEATEDVSREDQLFIEEGIYFQTGWHGSAAHFLHFDNRFMGAGVGAQAFGYGQYISAKKEVANSYRVKAAEDGEGQLYKVEIPDNNELLNWDMELRAQKNILKMIKEQAVNEDIDDIFDYRGTGGDFYENELTKMLGSPKEASAFLNRAGVKGNKHFDKRDNAYNFVIFNDSEVKITQTYYSEAFRDAGLSEFMVNYPDIVKEAARFESGEEMAEYYAEYFAMPDEVYRKAHALGYFDAIARAAKEGNAEGATNAISGVSADAAATALAAYGVDLSIALEAASLVRKDDWQAAVRLLENNGAPRIDAEVYADTAKVFGKSEMQWLERMAADEKTTNKGAYQKNKWKPEDGTFYVDAENKEPVKIGKEDPAVTRFFNTLVDGAKEIYPDNEKDPETIRAELAGEERTAKSFVDMINTDKGFEEFISAAFNVHRDGRERGETDEETRQNEAIFDRAQAVFNTNNGNWKVAFENLAAGKRVNEHTKQIIRGMIRNRPLQYMEAYAMMTGDDTWLPQENDVQRIKRLDTEGLVDEEYLEKQSPEELERIGRRLSSDRIKKKIENRKLWLYDSELEDYERQLNEDMARAKKLIAEREEGFKEYRRYLDLARSNARKQQILLEQEALDTSNEGLKASRERTKELSKAHKQVRDTVNEMERFMRNDLLPSQREAFMELQNQLRESERIHAELKAIGDIREIKKRNIRQLLRKPDLKTVSLHEAKYIEWIQAHFDSYEAVARFIGRGAKDIRKLYNEFATNAEYRETLKKKLPIGAYKRIEKIVYEDIANSKVRAYGTISAHDRRVLYRHLLDHQAIFEELGIDILEEPRKFTSEEWYNLRMEMQDRIPADILYKMEGLLEPATGAEKDERIGRRFKVEDFTIEEIQTLAGVVSNLRKEGREREAARKDARALLRQEGRDKILKTLLENMPKDAEKQGMKGIASTKLEEEKRSGLKGVWYALHNARRFFRRLEGGKDGFLYDFITQREYAAFDQENGNVFRRRKEVEEKLKKAGIDLKELGRHTFTLYNGNTVTLDEMLTFYYAQYNERASHAVIFGNFATQEERNAIKALADEKDIIGQMNVETQIARRYHDDMKKLDYFFAQEGNGKYRDVMNIIGEDYDGNYDRLKEFVAREYNEELGSEPYYMPLMRQGVAAQENTEVEQALADHGLSHYINKGFTKGRVDIPSFGQQAIQAGFYSMWDRMVVKQEHLMAYDPLYRELQQIFRGQDSQTLRDTLITGHSQAGLDYVDRFISELAAPPVQDNLEALSTLNRIMRGHYPAAVLGWRIASILKQAIESPPPFFQYVAPWQYAAAGTACLKQETRDMIREKSVYMKARYFDPAAAVVKEMERMYLTGKLGKAEAVLAKLESIGMKGQEWIDAVCVMPGWLAAYNKKFAELNNKESNMSAEEVEAKAVRYADQVVRDCQPSSVLMDQVPLLKGDKSSFARMFMQFQTPIASIFQQLFIDAPANFKQGRALQALWTWGIYALLAIVIGAMHEEDDDDELDPKKRGIDALVMPISMVPIFGGDLSYAAESLMRNGKITTPRRSNFPVLDQGIRAVNHISDQQWGKSANNTVKAFMYSTGLPVAAWQDIEKAIETGRPQRIIGIR